MISQDKTGVGVITIFTILLVLLLSVFAVLTLHTARADLALSKINAQSVEAYYAADLQAKRIEQQFLAGEQLELSRKVLIAEGRWLYINLQRQTDGSIKRIAWQTMSEPEKGQAEKLPVWQGDFIAEDDS